MPELPEVETIRCQLEAIVPGWAIASVPVVEPMMLRDVTARELKRVLPGRVFGRPQRQGKYLLLPLSGGLWLTIHLGMTGRILVLDRRTRDPHDRFVFSLTRTGDGGADAGGAEGKAWFVFRDIRKFGRVELTSGGPAERVARLGPDGWRGEWDAEYLERRLKGRKAPIKALLLDQRILAGVGNIYADESLFQAGILPFRAGGSLSSEEVGRLAKAVRAALDRGVRALGCSISDFVHVDGRLGSMQENLQAYGRQGLDCTRCGSTLQRTIVGGRGTAYCPGCQC